MKYLALGYSLAITYLLYEIIALAQEWNALFN